MLTPEGGYFLIRFEAVDGQYGVVAIDDVSLAYGSCSDIDDVTTVAGKIYCTKTQQNLKNSIRCQNASTRCIVHWRVSLGKSSINHNLIYVVSGHVFTPTLWEFENDVFMGIHL